MKNNTCIVRSHYSIIKWEEHVTKTTWPVASLKWRRLLLRRFNSSPAPFSALFHHANYRHCIPSHLFSPSLLATTRPPFSLSFSRPFALYLDLPPYGWGVMHERGTLADGERRGGNQSEEGLWNNNEVSVSRSSASVMHGIYVKGNSSKRYKRGIRT